MANNKIMEMEIGVTLIFHQILIFIMIQLKHLLIIYFRLISTQTHGGSASLYNYINCNRYRYTNSGF
jgi:hypothetical protein